MRQTRLLLAAGGLPLGVLQLGLLVASTFLHVPGEAESDALGGLHPLLHQHDFQLTGEIGNESGSATHCPGCLLERNPALLARSAVSPDSPARSVPLPTREVTPAKRSSRPDFPRGPPRS